MKDLIHKRVSTYINTLLAPPCIRGIATERKKLFHLALQKIILTPPFRGDQCPETESNSLETFAGTGEITHENLITIR